jgi:hypothetical protein
MGESGIRRRAPANLVFEVVLRERSTPIGNAELSRAILAALDGAGWALVPRRRPMVSDKRQRMLGVYEGQITSRNLIEAAAEFETISDGEIFAATDFVAWFLPEVKGSPEHKWLERLRNR